MSSRPTCVRAALRAFASLAVALALCAPGVASAAQEEPEAAEPGSISVHGYWTIDVVEPDGTLVSHDEFENSLDAASGNQFLDALLSRQQSMGAWLVVLHQATNNPCGPAPCVLIENVTGQVAGFRTLVVSVPSGGPNAGKLVLSGSMTASADGDILSVETDTFGCAPTTPADQGLSCPSVGQNAFTAHVLPSPITVTAGQQVQVSVVISFS